MTLREWALEQLTENGLWPHEAEAVVSRYLAGTVGQEMANRMSDDVAGYPPQLMAIMWFGLQREAVEWIDANCPQHFARAMFGGAADAAGGE